jgi:putative tryptophan/tyrosine transport system substrate-binding protein
MQFDQLGRREFITLLGGAAAAWPLAARAQQARPVIAFLRAGSGPVSSEESAFQKGLGETGYVEGQNVTIEYHSLDGQYDRLPTLVADLLARHVAVIATPAFSSTPTITIAKATGGSIPIVFGVGDDPVKLGLVASLARPGGNATGINFFVGEIVTKRFALLHELAPRALRIGVMVNQNNPAATEATLTQLDETARVRRLQLQIVNAGSNREIDAAFETIAREHCDALFVGPDAFFASRRVQFATLAARLGIPASYSNRNFPEVGGLMSYGTSLAEVFRPSRGLCRPDSQRHQACRAPGSAIDQIRVCHQPADCEGARHRGTARNPRERRRGDRVGAPGKAGAIQPVQVRPK